MFCFMEVFQYTNNLCHVWSFSVIWPQTSADEVLQYMVCYLSDLTFTVLIIRECLNAHFTEENTETIDINLKSRTRKDNEIRSLFSQALFRLRRPSTLCRLCRPSTLCRLCRLSTLCRFCRLSTLPFCVDLAHDSRPTYTSTMWSLIVKGLCFRKNFSKEIL